MPLGLRPGGSVSALPPPMAAAAIPPPTPPPPMRWAASAWVPYFRPLERCSLALPARRSFSPKISSYSSDSNWVSVWGVGLGWDGLEVDQGVVVRRCLFVGCWRGGGAVGFRLRVVGDIFVFTFKNKPRSYVEEYLPLVVFSDQKSLPDKRAPLAPALLLPPHPPHLFVLQVAEDLTGRVDPVHSQETDRLRNVLGFPAGCAFATIVS